MSARKVYWIGFSATLLRRETLALVTSSVPRTGFLSIDCVTEKDYKGSYFHK